MSLNPCFSGGWSQRRILLLLNLRNSPVLILVLVEDGLRGLQHYNICEKLLRLNPCFSGGWSQSNTMKLEYILVPES